MKFRPFQILNIPWDSFFYVPEVPSVWMERVCRFRMPVSLWMFAGDSSFSSSHRSLTFMILFRAGSFSASYLFFKDGVCHVIILSDIFSPSDPEQILLEFYNLQRGTIIDLYDRIIRQFLVFCQQLRFYAPKTGSENPTTVSRKSRYFLRDGEK